MTYTVKKLSELSGVTVRTLHYYEEIGLLKPAYTGSNGYRYYEQKELLILQQILFFKELGFKLKQIQNVLGKKSFDQLEALCSHKRSLAQEREKLGRLLKTIDKTINYLNGSSKMNAQEIFDGFSLVTKAKGGETYFEAEAVIAASIAQSGIKTNKISKSEVNEVAQAIFQELVECIEDGKKLDSKEVQKILKKHHRFVEKWQGPADKKVYSAMAQMYLDHPEFRKQLGKVDSRLASFMSGAMKVFAEKLK